MERISNEYIPYIPIHYPVGYVFIGISYKSCSCRFIGSTWSYIDRPYNLYLNTALTKNNKLKKCSSRIVAVH